MKNTGFFIVGLCWALAGLILFNHFVTQDMGAEESVASIAETLAPVTETADSFATGAVSEPVCENYGEIEEFDNPVPVVWTATMTGCLMSCQGAHFTRFPGNGEYDYPRFAAYYKEGTMPEQFMLEGLALKITGNWTGVEADHARTVFNSKCVPIVEIEKIELAD